MILRQAAIAATILVSVPLGPVAAQYAAPPYVGPSGYPAAPPYDDEESVLPSPYPGPPYPAAPYTAPAAPAPSYPPAPYPPESNAAVAPPPAFVPPNGSAAPYGHVPGIQRSDAVPGQEGPPRPPGTITPDQQSVISALPPEDQPEVGEPKELPPQLRRQEVEFRTKEPAGTIIIDTGHTYLYLIEGGGKAIRYGIGVGREGFTWSGTERISRKAEWPDWYPPAEMIDRQPYLPRFMAGGESNPLGARALYLGNTLYRIHGTNQPSTIGKFVSSGCVRLLNQDIEDLFDRVKVGTRVIVLPGTAPPAAQAQQPTTAQAQPLAPPAVSPR
ncbi:MAG TPA: L,D-transpeptidase [Xanthobacteraceae bacterium]|nr:L,D-transpeptidase [Xanthobacteraceae bacterium]